MLWNEFTAKPLRINDRNPGAARTWPRSQAAVKHLLEEVAVPVQIKGRNGQISGKPGNPMRQSSQ